MGVALRPACPWLVCASVWCLLAACSKPTCLSLAAQAFLSTHAAGLSCGAPSDNLLGFKKLARCF